MVQGIDNIGICTTDLTQSVTFYEMLGFSEAYRNDRGVTMTAGTTQLFLFQVRRSESLWRPLPTSIAGGAGARPDHPISGILHQAVWRL